MSRKTKTIIIWIISFVFTVGIGYYQRRTGPTHPVRGKEKIGDVVIKYKFLRSYVENKNLPVKIEANKDIKAFLYFRRYKADEDWKKPEMKKDGDKYVAYIDGQPPAGKVEYKVSVLVDNKEVFLNDNDPVIVRYQGKVPFVILFFHVLFMFSAMLFAVRLGLEILRKDSNYEAFLKWTLIITTIGGFILGPIVQKYAFGDFWTGFPYGTDFTDNKTLIVIILLFIAYFFGRKKKWFVLGVVIVMIIVYLIPHSIMGSELNYKTGKMKNKFSYKNMNFDKNKSFKGVIRG